MKSNRNHRFTVLLAALSAASTASVCAAPDVAISSVTTIMSGLNAPRGLTVGPDGGVYVAEAGSAFDTTTAPFVVIRGANNYYGTTGSVSRSLGGVQTRVITDLPTLREGNEAGGGPTDIGFVGGNAYVTIGMGLDIAQRTGPFTNLGNILRFSGASGTGTVFSDVAAYEAANNPNGDDLYSNPFKFGISSDGSTGYVVDAGANALLSVDGAGTIGLVTTFGTLAPAPVPFPPFSLAAQSVPTSVVVTPDSTIYVGELGGFPFTPGASRLHRIAPGGSVADVLATGFTQIIDLGLSGDGLLYVLEYDSNGLGTMGESGALYALDPLTGGRTLLTDSLVAPTGLTVGPDGTIYVSNYGNGDGLGEVLAISVIPEPATATALVGAAMLGLAVSRRRKRAT